VCVIVIVKALEVIKSALNDSWVRTGRRYSLLQRAKKICQSTAVKKSAHRHNSWQDFAADYMNDVSEPHSVIIVVFYFASKFVLYIVNLAYTRLCFCECAFL